MRTDNSDRARRHIAMLKEKGRYEEYKRKKAKCAKERRMKNKQNEQYLPPELQLHLMNERRRATRERVKRWRDRKSQNCQELTTESLESDSKMLLQEMNTQDRLLTEEANIDEMWVLSKTEHQIFFVNAFYEKTFQTKEVGDNYNCS